MFLLPGRSYRGALPPLTEAQGKLRDELRADVDMLAGIIGRRSTAHPRGLRLAAEYLETSFRRAGWQVRWETFVVGDVACSNIIAEGADASVTRRKLVVGAHYDAVFEQVGANDNASGVAALLAIARRLPAEAVGDVDLRLVAWVNEEPPHFQSPNMGAVVNAESTKAAGERLIGAISLETIGYYRDEPGTQEYPAGLGRLFPSRGNFLAFVSDLRSYGFLRRCVGAFRKCAQFPSEGGAVPALWDFAGLSDHWAYWQAGYPGLMVTDTAPYRYPFYHTAQDTPEKLDYEKLARVTEGLVGMVAGVRGKGSG